MEVPGYIIVVSTTQGPVTERHATYEHALQRIAALPEDILLSTPLLFKELPDGSQRLVRADGKPLQVHRLPYDEAPVSDQPLPLVDDNLVGDLKPHREENLGLDSDDEPLSLDNLPPPDPGAI